MVPATYYWSRVSSAIGRLAQYTVGHCKHVAHAGGRELHIEATGVCYREALITFFLVCATCKVSLSWRKAAGGDTVVKPPTRYLAATRRAVHQVDARRLEQDVHRHQLSRDSEESCTAPARQSTRGPSSDPCTSCSRSILGARRDDSLPRGFHYEVLPLRRKSLQF